MNPAAAVEQAPPQVVLALAGHVDHGKTSLVKALTGTDTDRLPEEKRRGLTIELGFAFLAGADHGQSFDLAFVDCPGHVRYIRQAITGLSVVAGAVLLVDAQQGIQAQTHEHAELLRVAGCGWVQPVLTKADLVDAETLAKRQAEVAELRLGAAPLAVSAHAGTGIDSLRQALFAQAEGLLGSAAGGPARLAVDRAFRVAGTGLIVAGSLMGDALQVGQRVTWSPGGSGDIRGLQVGHQAVTTALPGQRVAVNLHRLDGAEPARGSWLGAAGELAAGSVFDVQLETLPGVLIQHGQRVQIHHGSTRVAAQVTMAEDPGAGQWARIRCSEPMVAPLGNRLIVRRGSPSATLAAATVLAVDGPRLRRTKPEFADWFAAIAAGPEAAAMAHLEAAHPGALATGVLAHVSGVAVSAKALIERLGHSLRRCGDWLWTATGFATLAAAIDERLQRAAASANPWLGEATLKRAVARRCQEAAWDAALAALVDDGVLVRDRGRVIASRHLAPLPTRAARELWDAYARAGLQPGYNRPTLAAQSDPSLAEQAMAGLRARGWLIRLSDRQHVARPALEALVSGLATAFTAEEPVDLQWFKRHFGLTRKHAVPLAEWCDANGLTQRVDSVRVPGPRLDAATPALPVPALGAPPAR